LTDHDTKPAFIVAYRSRIRTFCISWCYLFSVYTHLSLNDILCVDVPLRNFLIHSHRSVSKAVPVWYLRLLTIAE